MKRAFVTGGSGFVGGRVIRQLRARGVEVSALARSARSASLVEALGAAVVHGDLDEPAAMQAGMAGADVVIHAAAETRPRTTRPAGPYPLSKGLAEDRVLAANQGGLATVIVRPRFVWGAGDTSLIPKIVEVVKRGRFGWIGGGRYLTSTCHVTTSPRASCSRPSAAPPARSTF